jgi:hypothetical protein
MAKTEPTGRASLGGPLGGRPYLPPCAAHLE